MKLHHSPHHHSHWVAVTLVLAAFLLTLSDAHGQSTGAASAFEGRPAMAGAQGGLGAQAGPAQGGIGVQGTDGAQRGVAPRGLGARDATANADLAAAGGDGVKPARDQSVAKDQRTAVKKAKRATKRTITRGRHGTSEIDSTAGVSAR